MNRASSFIFLTAYAAVVFLIPWRALAQQHSEFSSTAETLSFREFQAGGGGTGFVLNGEGFFIDKQYNVKKIVNEQVELVMSAPESSEGPCGIETFNVEAAGGLVYLIGGLGKNDPACAEIISGSSDKTWIYNLSAQTVTEGPRLNYAREVFASGVADGKVYVIGGWNSANNPTGENFSSVEMLENNLWTVLTTSGSFIPVRSPAYATLGSKIYLFGGCAGPEQGLLCPCRAPWVQVLDTTSHAFSRAGDMALAGRHFSGQHAAVRNQYIYVFGGSTDFSCTIYDDIGVYHPGTDSWQLLDAHMTTERKSTGSLLINDRLYVFGGMSCNPAGQCAELEACENHGAECNKRGAGTDEVGVFVSIDTVPEAPENLRFTN